MKKTAAVTLFSILLLFVFAAPSFSKGVYILCYHAFLEKKDPYSFTNDQFRDQLIKLKNSGFKFVTFEDVISDRIEGNKNVLISIDDGNHSVYQAYYSIMKPLGIKPMLGIYPAIIGRMSYAMTWDQVKKLADEGCYIASHGYHHMYLSEKYYKEEPASFKKEIYHSKKVLEEKLNRKIETMIYPFGVFSDISTSELKNAGYKYGLSIQPRMENLPVRDTFQIHRYLMTKSSQKGVIAFISKKGGAEYADNTSNPVNADSEYKTGSKSGESGTSFITYTDRIKKIILSNIVVINTAPISDKKNKKEFKPYIQSSKKSKASKSRKLTAKNEKKNQKKKKAV